jgi:6-phosphogluconolactonase
VVRVKRFYNLPTRLILAAMMLFALLAGVVSPVAAQGGSWRAVYTLTNAADGNEVLVYDRAVDGTLSFRAAYETGGLGSGAGLGSQGALALSPSGRWLLAVNAGSDEISIFAVRPNGLVLVDKAPSGGVHPISVAVHARRVYVLNDGDSGNITGFFIGFRGKLIPIPRSTRPLSNGGEGPAPGPAQISFTPDGRSLVVTEKATNLIDTYNLRFLVARGPEVHESAGETPFGFAITRKRVLIVSEAFGGAEGASALSSYAISRNNLDLISPSVGTTQTAACWVVVTRNGKYAYTTNTGSSSISSYRVGHDGSLSLLDPASGFTGDGTKPIDMAFSLGDRYLYALSGGTPGISAFRLMPDGSLDSLGITEVPAGSVGLAAQ